MFSPKSIISSDFFPHRQLKGLAKFVEFICTIGNKNSMLDPPWQRFRTPLGVEFILDLELSFICFDFMQSLQHV